MDGQATQEPLIRVAAAADAPALAALRAAAVPAAYVALDHLLPPPGGAAAGAVPALGPAGLRGAAPPAAYAPWFAVAAVVAGQQPYPYDFLALCREGTEVAA